MTNDLVPAEIAESHRLLDDFELQVLRTIALGRRLLANPHPSRPLCGLRPDCRGESPFLCISVGDTDPETVQAWAALLDAPVEITPSKNFADWVHHIVRGELDGVPVEVRSIITVPITRATIVTNAEGVRIEYVQGGARKSVPQKDKTAARAWVARYTTPAVPAC